MLTRFTGHISNEKLFAKNDRLLLAISGGIDSTVLAHLLKKSGYDFSLAHCNFKLRGPESDADEDFCRQLAGQLEVPFYVKAFDVPAWQALNQNSVQMAARELRYAWFAELIKEQKFSFLLTAHHAGDQVETVFINLCRGTGIRGMRGMLPKNNVLVRPLLNFTRAEIEAFARSGNIVFREDRSNADIKYERNFIRHRILPALKEMYPAFESTFQNNLRHFKQEAAIVETFLESKRSKLTTMDACGRLLISKMQLLNEPFRESILHHLLQPYGFNESQEEQILNAIQTSALPGKMFISKKARLNNDRDYLVVENLSVAFSPIVIKDQTELQRTGFFRTEETTEFLKPAGNEFYVDAEKLIFPLTIRSKKDGDKFQPFGMKSKKLLSDFFKDIKLNVFDKEQCRLLVNGNGDIMWLIGYRSDERYRVKGNETKLIKLSVG